MNAGGFLLLPVLLLIPPLVAVILYPDLATQFPQLKKPTEAAYCRSLHAVSARGMIGADGLRYLRGGNRRHGCRAEPQRWSTRKELLQPDYSAQASTKELLILGKIVTAGCGIIMIGIALAIAKYRQINMFDFVLIMAAMISLPLTVPLFWGLFIKRTPAWSAWSTALVSLAVAAYAKFYIPSSWFQHAMGWTKPLSERESIDTAFFTTLVWRFWQAQPGTSSRCFCRLCAAGL